MRALSAVARGASLIGEAGRQLVTLPPTAVCVNWKAAAEMLLRATAVAPVWAAAAVKFQAVKYQSLSAAAVAKAGSRLVE